MTAHKDTTPEEKEKPKEQPQRKKKNTLYHTMVHCSGKSFVPAHIIAVETGDDGAMTMYLTHGHKLYFTSAESIHCRALMGWPPAQLKPVSHEG